jgi:hypothetical protein
LIGATVLANVDGDDLRPVLAVLLMLVGLRIPFRSARRCRPRALGILAAREAEMLDRERHDRTREEHRGGGASPGKDANRILDAQHRAGNAAVAAWLGGRGPGAGKGATADGFLAGRQSDVAVQTDPGGAAPPAAARTSQTVNIGTVSGPKDLGRGGYDWKVWFALPAAAGNAGWVIQEVKASFTTDGTENAYHYWEAWEVNKGKSVTIWQEKGLDDNDDQYFAPAAAAKTKGVNKLVGKAKFYEGALPDDFKKNNPSTIAGILHSSTTAPSFWDGTGMPHNITATWDDADGKGQSDVTAVQGSTVKKGQK